MWIVSIIIFKKHEPSIEFKRFIFYFLPVWLFFVNQFLSCCQRHISSLSCVSMWTYELNEQTTWVECNREERVRIYMNLYDSIWWKRRREKEEKNEQVTNLFWPWNRYLVYVRYLKFKVILSLSLFFFSSLSLKIDLMVCKG